VTHRIIPSPISHSDALMAIPQGLRPAARRGWLSRWLSFLAAAWLPSRPTILKGR
jgi:hypothetical protein